MKTTEFVEEQPFQLHSYRKQELAMLYFPSQDKNGATRSLRRWIVQCPTLNERLIQEGYSIKHKFYSRREVELIVEFLGLP